LRETFADRAVGAGLPSAVLGGRTNAPAGRRSRSGLGPSV